MALKEIKENRLKKREALKNLKNDPYPILVKRTHTTDDVRRDFFKLFKLGKEIFLVGRIMAFREHGGSTFLNIDDGSGTFQLFAKKDSMGEKAYGELLDYLDTGDFAQARGTLFKTKRGEPTLEIRDIKIIAKSLLPLPEKWHGLKDVEERYRKRYLDFLMNEDVRKIFKTRSKIISAIRKFLDSEGFIEVETSILQLIPGGASARPFKTHLNALDIDLYLRVAPELDLKKLLIGGFEKVYEIGRSFRNEGMDYSHNPEFTLLEFYWAYSDYKTLMKFCEKFLTHILKEINLYPNIRRDGKTINFETPWPRVQFVELFKKHVDIDFEILNRDSLAKKAEFFGIKVESHLNKGQVGDLIYKKVILPRIKEPIFVIHHPTELAPLAKPLPDSPKYDARFQLVADGWEIVNAFSELNDPVVQKKFFDEQQKQKKIGDEEAQRKDQSFLEALEYGMPPAAGFGMGVDRLTALLTNSHSVREVILFPTMRPKPE